MPSYPELNKLRAVSFTFDAQSLDKKIEYLLLANRNMIEHPEFVKQYSELLLFHLAYPQNKKVFMLAMHGVVCITNVLRSNKQLCGKLKDTCLPYTSFTTKYTHDLISWLNQQPECALCIDSFGDNKVSLYHWLGACINKFGKKHLAVATLPEDSLMQLEPRKERQLSFLLREVARLDNQPEVKDLLWSNLKIWISITSKAKDFSLLFNRIEKSKTFYNSVLLKTFDYQQLYEAPLPPASKLTNAKALDLQKVIRYSLTLTFRETDPATYFDIRSLQYFKLERGFSIALYGMTENRQLLYENYVGYTLFKNGYPVSYGGSWIFGNYARFGMNIFSPYRGGESGYILCQIIRTYKYCFRLEHIAVDPYMFGKGNPEGIDTGAFWFYFKFGFRHVDKQLNKMANVEFKKIKANKLYRTPRKTLIEFATGDIEISWTNERHIKRAQILENVEAIIKAKHQGNYNKALDASRLLFKNKRLMAYAAFAEWALFASAFHCKRKQLEELSKIISEKQKNVYRYNTKLIHFLKSIS